MFKSEKEQASELVLLMYYVLIFGAILAVVITIFNSGVYVSAPSKHF